MRQLRATFALVFSLGLATLAGCGPKVGAELSPTAPAEDCQELREELAKLEAAGSEGSGGGGWVTQARVDSILRMNEGIRRLQANDIAGAERAIVEAIAIDPTHAEAYLNLGKLHRKQQRLTEAEAMVRAAIDNMGDASRGDVHYELGAILVSQSMAPGASRAEQEARWREAIACFAKAVELEPERFKAHYHMGTLHEKLDEPEQADRAYRKCIELDASYSPCFVALGNMYIDYGLSNLAMAVLETGAKVNETDADMWNGLGRAFLALNRPRDAVAAYEKGRRIDPDKLDLLFGLGMAYAEIPLRKQAEAVLEEFVSMADGRVPEYIMKAAHDTLMRMQGPI